MCHGNQINLTLRADGGDPAEMSAAIALLTAMRSRRPDGSVDQETLNAAVQLQDVDDLCRLVSGLASVAGALTASVAECTNQLEGSDQLSSVDVLELIGRSVAEHTGMNDKDTS